MSEEEVMQMYIECAEIPCSIIRDKEEQTYGYRIQKDAVASCGISAYFKWPISNLSFLFIPFPQKNLIFQKIVIVLLRSNK